MPSWDLALKRVAITIVAGNISVAMIQGIAAIFFDKYMDAPTFYTLILLLFPSIAHFVWKYTNPNRHDRNDHDDDDDDSDGGYPVAA